MTIPSLGGNGLPDGIKIIHKPTVNDVKIIQSASEKVAPPPIQNQISTDTQTDNTNTVKSDAQKNIEKEYSIERFEKDYQKLLNDTVLDKLEQHEEERKKRLKLAIFSVAICIITGICVLIFMDGKSAGKIAGLIFSLTFIIWHQLQKSFEKKIKRKIMQTLMKAIPGFYWQETPPVTAEDIINCKIIPHSKNCSKEFDDCFVGKYRNVPIAVSECNFSITRGRSTLSVLRGVCIRIKMNKNFEGITVIRPKHTDCGDDFKDLKKVHLEEVKLEDPEFEKTYKVFSTDQIEARYLITTSFMERLKNIESAFYSEYAYCSFYGDSVYIAPHTGCDLFSLCSLIRPVTDATQFTTLFSEFVSILALVDHFKLDKKLGL